tara:strand:- start:1117 stop:1275 length:159 start_codon:yes stop_codon:yes gene_type:complete
MAKIKIKDKVKFEFAGAPEEGVVLEFFADGTALVFDGKYRYPVKKEILTKIK